ncbi:hypothetical protein BJ165DRAFT_1477949 [Panaeolus papilionaceus]|nr:hypothetical protein BJ165DRAFT_1477949 [Panaeolus papilionaceus]
MQFPPATPIALHYQQGAKWQESISDLKNRLTKRRRLSLTSSVARCIKKKWAEAFLVNETFGEPTTPRYIHSKCRFFDLREDALSRAMITGPAIPAHRRLRRGAVPLCSPSWI